MGCITGQNAAAPGTARFFQACRFCTYELFSRVRGTFCSVLFS